MEHVENTVSFIVVETRKIATLADDEFGNFHSQHFPFAYKSQPICWYCIQSKENEELCADIGTV